MNNSTYYTCKFRINLNDGTLAGFVTYHEDPRRPFHTAEFEGRILDTFDSYEEAAALVYILADESRWYADSEVKAADESENEWPEEFFREIEKRT